MVPTISAPILNALVGDLENNAALLPTGQMITPIATPGSTFVPLATGLRQDGSADAHGAITTALSPDGKTLLALNTGYNTGLVYVWAHDRLHRKNRECSLWERWL